MIIFIESMNSKYIFLNEIKNQNEKQDRIIDAMSKNLILRKVKTEVLKKKIKKKQKKMKING